MQTTRLTQLISVISNGLAQWWQRPWYTHAIHTIAVLMGFFSASAITPVIGAVHVWHVPIGCGLVGAIEVINYLIYYKVSIAGLTTLNSYKIGLIFALTLDAFKLAS